VAFSKDGANATAGAKPRASAIFAVAEGCV
jgi:hypothetical protein